MMTPASHNAQPTKRPTLLRRLRRAVVLVCMVCVLSFGAMPPKPANACVAGIDCILEIFGGMIMPGSWAQSIAGQIAATTSAYFKVLMQSMRMRGEYTSAMAEADYRNEVRRVALQARVQVQNIPSPNQSTCRATTAMRRGVEAGAAGDAATMVQAQLRLQQMLGLGATRVTTVGSLTGGNGGVGANAGANGGGNNNGRGPGGNPSGGGGGNGNVAANGERLEIGPSGNATSASVAREQHACRSGYMEATPGNIRRCEQLGVEISAPAAGEGSTAGIDTEAAILLDAVAFDNARHYQAAQDLCSNITVNAQFEIPSQRVALNSLDGIKRARSGYAEAAAATFAYFICAKAIEDRVPQGSQYTAIDSADNDINKMYARGGWKPLTSLTPWPPVATDADAVAPRSYASYTGGYYIPGRQPSPRQRREISEKGLSDSTMQVGSSTSIVSASQHMLKAKAVTLSQNMERLRQLEKQTLLAAIMLSRKVRNAN